MFFVVEREEIGKKMITGISGFRIFCPKWPFRDAYLFLKEWLAETPIFIVFLGARSFGQVVKKRKFWTPTKNRRKIWLIAEKLFFGGIFVFVFFYLFFQLFCFSLCFLGGFKGQVRWPEGPPHLALDPPSSLFVFLVLFLFLLFWEGLRVRWGGPKGHLTWP